jgi:HPt (histidine-containing phosphotransfer) domain-containing protein
MPEYNGMKILGSCAILSSDMRERCLTAGMDMVVEKPLDMNKLSTSIAKLFPEILSYTEPAIAISNNGLIAMNILNEHCATLGTKKVKSLYREAELSARRLTDQICTAEPDNHRLISGFAHALAGLCSNFGFIALGAIAGEIQQRKINSTNYTMRLQVDVQQLIECCEQTFEGLPNAISEL